MKNIEAHEAGWLMLLFLDGLLSEKILRPLGAHCDPSQATTPPVSWP